MGVVYKLKQEIVEQILQLKKQNPKISCRRLADFIKQNYQLEISKSSINSVLKGAHLSNPIGRTPLEDKTPQFKIPLEKKKELLENAKPKLKEILGAFEEPLPVSSSKASEPLPAINIPPPVPALEPQPYVEVEPPPISVEKMTLSALEPVEPELPEEQRREEIKPTLLPDPISQIGIDASSPGVPATETMERTWDDVRVNLNDLTLRMALWDLSRRPFMEGFWKHHTDLSDEEIKILDVLLCVSSFAFEGDLNVGDENLQGLWLLSGFEEPPSQERIQKVLKRIGEIPIDEFDFTMDVSYFFSFAYEIKMTLRDRSSIRIDPRFLLIGANARASAPMDISVENVSMFMTDRTSQAVLRCTAFSDSQKDIVNFIAACQMAANKEIESIHLYDKDNKEISEFVDIPVFKRNFHILTSMSAKEFLESFKIKIAFQEEHKLQYGAHTIYWMETDLFVQISEVSGDLVPIKALIYSPAKEAEDLLQVSFLPAGSLIDLQEERQFFEIQTIRNNKDMNISVESSLNKIKNVKDSVIYIKKCLFSYKDIDEKSNITLNLALQKFKKRYCVEIKQHSPEYLETVNALIQSSKLYNIRTYDKKVLQMANKI